MSSNMQSVFSYGSNSLAQLRARIHNPSLQALPAKAENWQRIFCKRAPVWKGTVVARISDTVHL
jgi:hypothetical protein